MTGAGSAVAAGAKSINMVLVAIATGLIGLLCAGAVYFAWPGGGPTGDPPAGTPPAAASSPPGTEQPTGGATERDATADFRAYVHDQYEREPAWLGIVDQVTWTVDGGLWARTTADAAPNRQPMALICLSLSAYVAEAGQAWHGVGVHAADGTEVLRRDRLDDTTTCAI